MWQGTALVRAHPRVLYSFLGATDKREAIQGMVKVLEIMLCEKWEKEMGLLNLRKRRQRNDMLDMFKIS